MNKQHTTPELPQAHSGSSLEVVVSSGSSSSNGRASSKHIVGNLVFGQALVRVECNVLGVED